MGLCLILTLQPLKLSLNDFSVLYVQKMLTDKFGPHKPTLEELVKNAMTALAKIKSRLEEH